MRTGAFISGGFIPRGYSCAHISGAVLAYTVWSDRYRNMIRLSESDSVLGGSVRSWTSNYDNLDCPGTTRACAVHLFPLNPRRLRRFIPRQVTSVIHLEDAKRRNSSADFAYEIRYN